MLKKHIQKVLEKYTKKYLQKFQPKLVLVTGSVGKTTTKLAIAAVLNEKYRVRVHPGNHNTHLSVPLAILGIDYPDDIRSWREWWRVRKAAKKRLKQKEKDCDVIVQELGADAPGDVIQFARYLYADVAVVTAVSPEHMEYFKTMDMVAQEELAVSQFSRVTAINHDDVDKQYAQYMRTPSFVTYGLDATAEYRLEISDESIEGISGTFISSQFGQVPVQLQLVSESGAKAAVAAAFVGTQFDMTLSEIASGLTKITAAPGRMNLLKGLKGSTIIDDTYNASPLAVEAALKTLYRLQAPQKVVILGDMNELGETSAAEHEKVGHLINPESVHYLVTIGPQTKKYTVPIALQNGVSSKAFDDPLSAGAFVHSIIEKNALVLAKGSQNGIFAEEAIKIILHDEVNDSWKLVRQTPDWLAEKDKQFEKFKEV
jgi:UDP-N-acetylmuramoyl-tripeptide--D-alanyl-D-alanine ligase